MDETDIVQYLRQDSHVIPVSKRYEAASEIERLRFLLKSLRDNFSTPGPDPRWKLETACKVIDQALSN